MSDEQEDDKDPIQRTGTFMTVAGWILFGFLLVMFFGNMLDKQRNPNFDVDTHIVAGQKEVVLQRNRFGHYVATGSINGHKVVFLVDTGATDVAIPEATAERLGLRKGHAYKARTANGLATAWDTQLDSVMIGDIELRDIDASILGNNGLEEILLGMSFLKKLELVQKGETLTIRQ